MCFIDCSPFAHSSLSSFGLRRIQAREFLWTLVADVSPWWQSSKYRKSEPERCVFAPSSFARATRPLPSFPSMPCSCSLCDLIHHSNPPVTVAMPSVWTWGNCVYPMHLSDPGVLQFYEQESRMSSLGRRACYKCGNVGHYAGSSFVESAWRMLADRVGRGLLVFRETVLQL